MKHDKNIKINTYLADVQQKADKIVDKFVLAFFVFGMCLAPVYETWTFSFSVGGLNILLYITAKFIPRKSVSRHIISLVFSIFVLQFIGQMQGMAEAHFFFFTNIAILIIYQDWRIMIPYTSFAILHHSVFFFLQLLGYDHLGQYFINYTEIDYRILFFYFSAAVLMTVISGMWARIFRNRSIETILKQAEIDEKNRSLSQTEEELRQNLEEIQTTQDALTETQNRLNFALSETGVGIWECDLASNHFIWDSSCRNILGIGTKEEFNGKDWEALVKTDYLPEIQSVFGDFFSGKISSYVIEYETVPIQGKEKWLLAKGALKRKPDGTPVSIVGTLEDISKRKEIEKTVAQLSLVADKTNNGVVITDKNGLTIWVNKGFEKITAYPAEELIGKKPGILQGENTDPAHVQALRDGIASGKPFSQEILNYTKTGREYWISIDITPVFDEKTGDLIQFIGIEKDISKRKKLEQELAEVFLRKKAAKEALEVKKNELSRALAEITAVTDALDSSAIISITDHKGTIIKVNSIFCKVSGYSEAELIGQNHRIVNSGEHPKEFWVNMWKTVSRGETWRAEVCNRGKDGTLYWVDTVINPIRDEHGKVSRYLSIRALITERKRAEEDLNDSMAKLILLRQESEKTKNEAQKLLQKMKSGINYAKRIQNAVLISEKDMLRVFPESFIYYQPRDIVSGDFYWLAVKGNRKIIVVGDCTGHGVSGGFLTMIGHNILNQIVHDQGITEPDEILNQIPITLKKILLNSESKINDGMDLAILSAETSEKGTKLVYSGAMSPIYLVQNKELTEIKADKIPIGGTHKFVLGKYSRHEQFIEGRAMCYLFTDGYKDQFGGDLNRKFLSKNFKSLLLSVSGLAVSEQKEIIGQIFEDWKGDHKQTDDVLVVGIRF